MQAVWGLVLLIWLVRHFAPPDYCHNCGGPNTPMEADFGVQCADCWEIEDIKKELDAVTARWEAA